MTIPDDAIIPREKLTLYLLTPQRKNDKSRFLAQAGFTQENPDQLEQAIRHLISENEAIFDRHNEYGTFYRVQGEIRGPAGILSTITVWILLTNDNHYRFVTLKPAR
ncbi:MAG TPA: hypothetical protein PLD25_22515 [Chloroflexota bacterium]|nr:hypothetical protein [Chloroflexota bacterium]HUM71605.1 hypothetical protein [Chloroflexota bacterium]